jgi:SPP1 gp7 family putative phage head morphogenesis protein
MLPPKTIENNYKRELRRLVAEWKQLYLRMIDPYLDNLAAQAYALRPKGSINVKTDAWPEELDIILEGYRQRVDDTLQGFRQIAITTGNQTSQWNQEQWQKVVEAVIGAPLLTAEPWLMDQIKSFASQNVDLITKTAQEVKDDVGRIINDGLQRGKRVQSIRKDILSETKLEPGRFKKTKTRADLIAVDQVEKLNGQLSQLRQNEIGVERYTWRTVMDDRVRLSHQVMEGRLCRWDDSLVYSPDGGETWIGRGDGIDLHP